MNFKRIMSAFLTLVMVLGAVVFTTEAATVEATAAYADKVNDDGDPLISYTSQAFPTPEDKLETMDLLRTQDGYELYFEYFTGEVALKNIETEEVLFSNPYDIANGYNWASNSTKQKLLSQLFVTFEENGTEKTFASYTESALRGQIGVENIKNGIRVEYTVGEIAIQRLVPRIISKDRFESQILSRITDEGHKNEVQVFYNIYDTSDPTLSERVVKEYQASFPITKQFAIYVCKTDIIDKELKRVENIIKAYCPNYTFEELEQDHADCDYVASDKAPPSFRMAIEYTISEDGLEARLPASGIRFDESNFSLKSITMLPYMGCGSFENTGYTFFPDGSGTLVRFEDVKVLGTTYNVSGEMYGADYAYHKISGQHSETMRLPVFGIVEDKKVAASSSGANPPVPNSGSTEEETEIKSTGVFAVITEGDSLATLKSEHGGKLHAYNTVYASFVPRPSDQYNLADSISIGSNASWTVTSPRKYTGSYRIKYTMLSDAETIEKTGKGFEASYVGMANAYRAYLEEQGVITKLTSDDVKDSMPLYIESFGSIKTNEKFLSLPVTVDTPLTSFEDVSTIYAELAEEGITNVNFRLTGYYNGGLDNTYPAKLKWVKNLGGEEGFEELVAESNEKGYGVFPEFDMAYVKSTAWFDGINEKRDLVKSIDDRYMSKRNYDAAMQSFESDFALAISPSVYSYFYEKLNKEMEGYTELGNISASTLGTDLNSDFDDEDPYNREDSKTFTTNTLASLDEKYSVMVDGGNAYAIRYADHLIDVPTESSNFLRASESIPFYAMVFHGYVNYTAGALNMEGDIQYAILKSIENGAALYFTLCYDNTSSLKENEEYNKYYSVSYDIWKEDMISYYTEINSLLGDIQTESIVNHEFISAVRTIVEEETEPTEEELEEQEKEEAAAKAEEERKKKREELLASRGQSSSGSGSGGSGNRPGAGGGNEITLVEVESGTVVAVTYEGGTTFVINYNSFAVDAEIDGETVNIEALSYVEIDSEKGGDQ